MVISCSKDTPAPTAEIFATIDGYTVTFNPTVTDVSTYAWDFDDGETSTEAKPVHTYAFLELTLSPLLSKEKEEKPLPPKISQLLLH